ncbi:Uncharacterized protein AK812_SmicGene24952 [Symbiodinium microadriaticum]|uniref:HECT domain-containing protein n=1 Tax=Symbiodinium microadriaticum TaxID=2951 RepID=A0A1Q9DD85_SYMMI|nr:Uncharacterized protein AK812_SmicGene24952 [Symbiodinium microadriaticum]
MTDDINQAMHAATAATCADPLPEPEDGVRTVAGPEMEVDSDETMEEDPDATPDQAEINERRPVMVNDNAFIVDPRRAHARPKPKANVLQNQEVRLRNRVKAQDVNSEFNNDETSRKAVHEVLQDVGEWRRYSDQQADAGLVISWFWEIVEDSMAALRSPAAAFASLGIVPCVAVDVIMPPGGFAALKPRFGVARNIFRGLGRAPPTRSLDLRRAHTCINQIVLHRYSSKEKLRCKLSKVQPRNGTCQDEGDTNQQKGGQSVALFTSHRGRGESAEVELEKAVMEGFNCMLKCTKAAEQVEGTEGVWEAICGDDTGVCTISFRNKEVADVCKVGASIRMQNTSVRMVKGYIRVVVDKWAAFKPADEALEFEAKTANDVSGVEYELVES